jgi:hypothetical protein
MDRNLAAMASAARLVIASEVEESLTELSRRVPHEQ